MLTLLTSDLIRAADKHTISRKQISSADLMETAASAFVEIFKGYFPLTDVSMAVYCGMGNNGGDGLAIARLLKEHGYDHVSVKIARYNSAVSEDFDTNLKRLSLTGIAITDLHANQAIHDEVSEIIIDALLGSGLTRPLEGDYRRLVEHLNHLKKTVVSVDVPTGFPSEGVIEKSITCIKAALVISFQRPKLNFYFPESADYLDKFRFVDIGLDESFIQSQSTGWKLLEPDDIRKILRKRKAFSHKGTYGHALVIAGQEETMGAALLCSDACLHTGAGLTTAYIPKSGLTALNSLAPEVMALIRDENNYDSFNLEKYQAIAIGPGLGTDKRDTDMVYRTIASTTCPVIIDADGLNMISVKPDMLRKIPRFAILTPHMKEFDRLFGSHQNWWERVETGRAVAQQYEIVIVLKNQYSFIILPGGGVVINPTGNPAMSTGGSGDVLTGIIVGLLAQGYSSEESALAGCYLHGKAGDLLHEISGMNSIPARYLISKLPGIINSYVS